MSRRYSIETRETDQLRTVAVVETVILRSAHSVWGWRSLALVVLQSNGEERIFRADGKEVDRVDVERAYPEAVNALSAAGEPLQAV